MSSDLQSAVAMARQLVRAGKPYGVAIRAAADDYGVSSADVSAGLRGAKRRKHKPVERRDWRQSEQMSHVPAGAWWQD